MLRSIAAAIGSRSTVAAIIAVLSIASSALAQSTQPDQAPPPSTYDRIWNGFTNWYDNRSNPVIQRVVFTGRFQEDLATIDAEQGDHDEANVRRMRLGPKITFLGSYLLHVEVELNPQEHDPLYRRLTDAYVAWQKHPQAVITVGKQSVPFTQEGATSSKELLTIDRSNLANTIWFTQEYMPGVSVSGRAASWTYRGGVYSSGAMNREFGEFNGGAFTLLLAGYDFGKKLGVREATLTANYLYQQPDIDNTFTRHWKHVVSTHFKLEQPSWGFRGEVSATAGYLGQRNVHGVMAMPYVNLTGKAQLVFRYDFVDSDGINGLGLNTYEDRVVNGRGDRYDEEYVGFNYYLYGHRLKLQTGLQFEHMRDVANDGGAFSGTSWTTGLRIGW